MENTDKKTKTVRIIIFALIVLGIVVLMKFVVGAGKTASRYEGFAQCLADKGTKFYGAFWCPHCQAQERMFGISRENLEQKGLYTECSTPDGKGQTQACKDAGVSGYPTWVFPDTSRLSGEIELKTLAEKSGCALP